jgi:hypothetical protein
MRSESSSSSSFSFSAVSRAVQAKLSSIDLSFWVTSACEVGRDWNGKGDGREVRLYWLLKETAENENDDDEEDW